MPYIRMRTRRSKLIRSWPVYMVIVLVTFLVAMSVSKCMAEEITTCKIYRTVVKFDTEKWNYQTDIVLGTLEIKTWNLPQEDIDGIAEVESLKKEKELRGDNNIILSHKCKTLTIDKR